MLRIRNFRDVGGEPIKDFVRSLLTGVGKDRMALNTFFSCAAACPAPPRPAPRYPAPPRPARRWSLWYGTRMWTPELYGANLSSMRFNDDPGGRFVEMCKDIEHFVGNRGCQVRQPGAAGGGWVGSGGRWWVARSG